MSAPELPDELRRVHMVGIGGAGMSGIARILLDRGAAVSGSDAKESRGVAALRARGATVRIGHDATALDDLPGGPTTVVSTQAAIPQDNPELVEARRRDIPVVMRPVVLAKLMAGYTTVLVTGTHGKTTTTSMIVVALQHGGLDPSFAIGGDLGQAGTNAHHGSGHHFVAEADESDGSLLQYAPDVAVVTNVEADHLDFFGTPEAYAAVFDDFVARLKPGGVLVACVDDPGAAAVARRATERGVTVLRYGSGDDPALAGALLQWEQQGTGGVATVRFAGESVPRAIRLAVPGRHMALNAVAAALAAVAAGADVASVVDGLAGFEGTRRRFEAVGTAAGVRVFDDYAHHPTEVRVNLEALRSVAGDGRSIVVFQPHLYSRTETFADQFAAALSVADEVFVLDVYAAREQPIAGVSGGSIAEHVSARCHYVPDFSAVADRVAAAAHPGDVVVTMGAGDVTLLGREILAALTERAMRR